MFTIIYTIKVFEWITNVGDFCNHYIGVTNVLRLHY